MDFTVEQRLQLLEDDVLECRAAIEVLKTVVARALQKSPQDAEPQWRELVEKMSRDLAEYRERQRAILNATKQGQS